MIRRHLTAAVAGLVIAAGGFVPHAGAQSPAAGATSSGRVASARDHVETLTSEELAGRRAGSDEERLAAEYIAAQLTAVGARPLPGRSSMLAPFEFTAGSRDGGSRLTVRRAEPGGGAVSFTAPQVQALAFSDSAEASGPAVFAGYGIVVPDSQNFGYDSYAGLDVTGRIVVVLRYFPEDAEPRVRGILARYSDLRYKAMAARQRGAAGLLVITGPRSPNAGLTIPMSFDTALAGSGIAAASVDGSVAASLFQGAAPLEAAQKALDSGNPHVAGFELPGVTVTLAPAVVREKQTARNVLAYLPATTPVAGLDKPWVVVGAHFDHLGRGEHGNSLAAGDEKGRPHAGADDNASGTAAVLAIGARLAEVPRRRHVLLAFWSAEEIGLVGSGAFVADPPVPLHEVAAYLNYDMVGRMQDNRLAVQATGTSPLWRSMLERVNVAAGFDVALQDDPYQPTDVATFNGAAVPSLSFTTGAHVDYHKPSDTADKINYEDLDRIASMGAAIVSRLMALDDPPQFTKVEQSSQTASRAGLRVFTGTVPDYTSDAKGLMLGGVVGGGPAEQAGLAKGDVIIEIAGQSIANIYDYTYALELLKIGEPARVVFMRGAERRETTLTPAARR
jgi:hypothetical protein